MSETLVRRKPLGRDIEVFQGFAFNSSHFSKTMGVPLIRIRDLSAGYSDTLYSGHFSDEYLVNRGDILIGMDGDFRVARWSGTRALLNQRVCRVRASEPNLDENFLFHALRPEIERVHQLTPQTTVRHLKIADITKCTVLDIPRDEQKRIAQILDTIDDAIECTEHVAAKYRQIRDALNTGVFTSWHARTELETRGATDPHPQANSAANVGRAMGVAARGYVMLRDIAHLNPESLGATTPPDFAFNYLDLTSVSNGCIDSTSVRRLRFADAPTRARRIVRDGDCLFGTVRPRLRSHVRIDDEGYIASTGFCAVRPKKNVADSRFLGHFLLSDEASRQAVLREAGSSYPAVTESDIATLRLPNLSLNEQRRAANVLDAIGESIRAAEDRLNKLRDLRIGLSNDLLSGRVRTVAA